MDTRHQDHQGRATKNKKTVGVTFVRDPLLDAEPCEGLLLFPGVGISWQPHLGTYDKLRSVLFGRNRRSIQYHLIIFN